MKSNSVKLLCGESAVCSHCGNDDMGTLAIDEHQPERGRTHVVCQKCGNLYKIDNAKVKRHQRYRFKLSLAAGFGLIVGLWLSKALGWF